MAVKRRLRVRAPIERRLSKSSRNAPTKDESICRSSRFDGCNLQVSLRELQQQPEGVSVGGNRVGTHIALTNQSSGEEALDQCRQVIAPSWPVLLALLQATRGVPKEFGACGQIPIGIAHADMAQLG